MITRNTGEAPLLTTDNAAGHRFAEPTTNPAVQAHAVLGRAMLDAVSGTTNTAARVRHPIETFRAADSA